MSDDSAPAPAKARIVVAEDEAIIRLDLVETLAEEGYDVVAETGRGDDALKLVHELSPDLAILDVRMPGLDGIEVAREIVETRAAGVLILTAFGQRELVERAADAGALAYLVKPWQRSDLIPAIEIALARHREVLDLVEENAQLANQLETRKVLDRAKGLLIDSHGLSENDAFRFLQQQAMNTRRSMREVADAVIAGEIAP
ncbi:MAG: response regulator [Acidimicrobiales bacterium]|nr:response regulator [Acidimicrobiales bacterium]RZV46859.1 MAG: response regulator [Acidimicrobiales bacterium]